MKKTRFTCIWLLSLVVGTLLSSFVATTRMADDFYVGKWTVNLMGIPNGDAKLVMDLARKDGKLTGELADASDANKPKIPLNKVEENGDKLTIYFDTSQAGEVSIELGKVDEDHLKGQLMNMFEAIATRIKN